MRFETIRSGASLVLLAVALVWLVGCKPKDINTTLDPPTPLEQLMTQADEAWQSRDYEEARRLYGIIAGSFVGDSEREEAILRMALMQVVLPGEGPDAKAALETLAGMNLKVATAGQMAYRDALTTLLGLYQGNREAVRMLLDQNRRLEAQLAGRQVEVNRQKENLGKWSNDVDRANQRVEQLEVELDKIRQEITLLKEIDMMLQPEAGDQPSPPNEVP